MAGYLFSSLAFGSGYRQVHQRSRHRHIKQNAIVDLAESFGPSRTLAFIVRMNPQIRRDLAGSISLILCTGGEYRGILQDRHLSAASSFQIGVRGRRTASKEMLARVSHLRHFTSIQR
jgi:hypothetical protein